MATYESLFPEIIASVPGASDALIKSSIRSALVELCEKTDVYQLELDPITTVKNVFEYDLEPPTDTVVHKILWMTYDGDDLEATTSPLLEQRKPKWRQDGYQGTPEFFVKQSQTLFYLAPVPNTTKTDAILLRAVLKPTFSSSSCSDDIMNDYRDTIVNGTLARMLRMPGRDFTDYTGAGVYTSLYQQGLLDAEQRGRQTEARVSRKVRYSGAGRAYKLTRTKYSAG